MRSGSSEWSTRGGVSRFEGQNIWKTDLVYKGDYNRWGMAVCGRDTAVLCAAMFCSQHRKRPGSFHCPGDVNPFRALLLLRASCGRRHRRPWDHVERPSATCEGLARQELGTRSLTAFLLDHCKYRPWQRQEILNTQSLAAPSQSCHRTKTRVSAVSSPGCRRRY